MRSRTTHVFFTALALMMSASLYSCNDETTNNTNPNPGSPGTTPSATKDIHIAAGAMNRDADAFGENPLNIAMGTTVRWINDDSEAHTATSDDGTSFDTGQIAPGATSTS